MQRNEALESMEQVRITPIQKWISNPKDIFNKNNPWFEQEQYESISCRNHLKFPQETSDFLRKVGTRKWSGDEPAKVLNWSDQNPLWPGLMEFVSFQDIKNIVKKGNKVVQSSEAFVALNPLPFLPCDMVVFGIMSGKENVTRILYKSTRK